MVLKQDGFEIFWWTCHWFINRFRLSLWTVTIRLSSPRWRVQRTTWNPTNYVHTAKNLADPFTKGLSRVVIDSALREIGMRPTWVAMLVTQRMWSEIPWIRTWEKQASGELRRVSILTHSVGDAILSILYGRVTIVLMCSEAYVSKMLSYRAIFGGTHLCEPDC